MSLARPRSGTGLEGRRACFLCCTVLCSLYSQSEMLFRRQKVRRTATGAFPSILVNDASSEEFKNRTGMNVPKVFIDMWRALACYASSRVYVA